MRTMGWFSRQRLSLVLAAMAVLIGMAAGQPASAAPGYWRFTGYSTTPPQSQLDEPARAMRAMGRTHEARVSGAFQPAGSGAGTVDLYFKNDDVDRRIYLTTLKFSFTAGVDMRVLTPGQKIHFNGVLVMGGNALSKALPAKGSGTIAAGNGDYFVTTNGAIDQSASGEGDLLISAGGDTLTIHVGGSMGAWGGLAGRMDLNYEWVAGPPPRFGPVGDGAAGGQTGGIDNQAGQPAADTADNRDLLGSPLQVSELGGRWRGVWTRRPGTYTYDAVWHGESDVTDILHLRSFNGNQVVFTRDGNGGTYTGTISRDGHSISGTASWYQPGWTWTAQIGGDSGNGGRSNDDAQAGLTGGCRMDFVYNGQSNPYPYAVTLSQQGASLAGSGIYPAGAAKPQYAWTVGSGSVSGDQVTFTATYTLGVQATMQVTGRITSDGAMQGTWTDDYGGPRQGTWTARRSEMESPPPR